MRIKKIAGLNCFRTFKTKNRIKPILLLFFLVAMLIAFGNNSASAYVPAQTLDLVNWKETLPTGSSGSPTEIIQPALSTYSIDPYFHVNSSSDGVIFRAPVNGVTTSGSGYPRSELREMTDSGKTKASWATNSGVHSMFFDAAITAVPNAKKHVVIGQIHDASDDVIVIRLEYPKLFVDINGATGPTLDANYTLGKRFNVKFVASNGQIKVFYNGSQTPAYTLNKVGSGNYFKAGAYTQSNCSKETVCSNNNFGEVVIYKLLVQHGTAIVEPAPVATTASSSTPTSPPALATTAPVVTNSVPFEAQNGTMSGKMRNISHTLKMKYRKAGERIIDRLVFGKRK